MSDAAAPKQHDPNFYKHTPAERFTINRDLEDIYASWARQDDVLHLKNDERHDHRPTPAEEESEAAKREQEKCVLVLLSKDPKDAGEFEKALIQARREVKCQTKKSALLRTLARMEANRKVDPVSASRLRPLLVKNPRKSQSGVLVVTVVMSPYPKVGDNPAQTFSCEYDCFYCPKEPDQPRSYLHDEPSVLRANRNGFDAMLQFYARVATLAFNGHPCDKVEMIILGGTWDSYPKDYREEFVRDLFYAANTFAVTLGDVRRNMRERPRQDIQTEKRINETTSGCKIIGMTMETRPDCVTLESIAELRRLGCTRVQLGVQHTDNDVLQKINRGHGIEAVARALYLLKNSCYKVDIHLMPNLPGSSPEKDAAMLRRALHDPDLQADQWKIYPTEVTPWTVIEKWFNEGTYVPYDERELTEVLIECKTRVHPWIRLNRVVRDIPSQYILGGVDSPSMRQDLQLEMSKRGLRCQCIRCREIGFVRARVGDWDLVTREYLASDGLEIFISVELKDCDVLVGFCRLRVPAQERRTKRAQENDEVFQAFPELIEAGLVRELHVYGNLATTPEARVLGSKQDVPTALIPFNDVDGPAVDERLYVSTQHVGVGKQLMKKAEEICIERGLKRVAVVAGVGSRGFYRKVGYRLDEGKGEMMMKELAETPGSSAAAASPLASASTPVSSVAETTTTKMAVRTGRILTGSLVVMWASKHLFDRWSGVGAVSLPATAPDAKGLMVVLVLAAAAAASWFVPKVAAQ